MSIEPKFLTFDELLQKRLFKIPDYQRAYSWTTKERKDLFNDILKLYEYNDYPDGYRNHFMATVVCCSKEKVVYETDEYEDFDIVDGQQRITSLIILLRSLLKKLQEENASALKRTIRNLEELIVKDEDNKLILIQTNHDSSIHLREYLLTGKIPDKSRVKTHATRNLVKAFEESEVFIQQWVDASHDLMELLVLIKNRLNFILHVIEDEGTVYTVFEVLNSRGLEVDWLDKCKSILMGIAFEKLNRQNINFNQTIQYLHDYWSQIYKEIGIESISGTDIVRFTATLNNPIEQSKIMKPVDAIDFFKELCSKDPEMVVEISKWLSDVTCEFKSLAENKKIQAVTNIIQARLVYVAIKLSAHFTVSEEEQLLKCWEQVTYKVYGLSHKDSRNLVGTYTKLAQQIMDVQEHIYLERSYRVRDIIEKFQEISDEYRIADAIKIIEDCDSYSNWEKQLVYLFYRYERYLASKGGYHFQEDVWDVIWNSPVNDSIEHIYPKNAGDSWKRKVIQRKDFHSNRIGNLVVLPIKMNQRAGTKSFIEKKKIYEESSLRSVKEVLNYSDWDIKTIGQRTTTLLDWIKEEWKDELI